LVWGPVFRPGPALFPRTATPRTANPRSSRHPGPDIAKVMGWLITS
jgi:hypothetical protein